MTFIVTLIAILIERFFDWSHLRHWGWFDNYQRFIIKNLNKQSPYIILAAIVLPLSCLVLILQIMFQGVLYGFVSLIFQLLVVLYCLGPQNLWADAFSCINALAHDDTRKAQDKIKLAFGNEEIRKPNIASSVHMQLLEKILIASNLRIFAVFFWYVILGPVGAVLYRAITLSVSHLPYHESYPEVALAARKIESIADWLPIRVLTFLFALAGNFTKVLSIWRHKAMSNADYNETFLIDCGLSALSLEEKFNPPTDAALESQGLALIDRVFVIGLVVIAVLALIANL